MNQNAAGNGGNNCSQTAIELSERWAQIVKSQREGGKTVMIGWWEREREGDLASLSTIQLKYAIMWEPDECRAAVRCQKGTASIYLSLSLLHSWNQSLMMSAESHLIYEVVWYREFHNDTIARLHCFKHSNLIPTLKSRFQNWQWKVQRFTFHHSL